jgi:hypothetical protein|nr:MAG TPA: Protein of unknown function (DUF669) [Caudoviricetes sp.]
MAFDFWAVANSAKTQNAAAAENESHVGGYIDFTEPGEYDLTVKHAEIKPAKAGYPTLSLRVRADSGESGFWTLLVGHGDGKSTAAQIAQRNLALILKYSGAKAFGPEAMIGLRVKAWVKIEEGSGGVERPVFRPIGPAEGAAPRPAQNQTSKPAAKQAPERFVVQDDDIPF